jgi:hypothetical protein
MLVQLRILNAIDKVCENILHLVQDTSSREVVLKRLQQTRNWVERMNEGKVKVSIDKIVNRIYRLRMYKLPKDPETTHLQGLLFPLETLIKSAIRNEVANVTTACVA